jgi:hypothetical protein
MKWTDTLWILAGIAIAFAAVYLAAVWYAA